ncbi:two-component system VirA-like sensor kinase [Inquilinus sp. NPDC058860]|uniref:two-component system VirA-like sensor kinase n=1 Tax=Inquilinus sp. NPDC058860 TaxID=3346652 RepID=UPI00368A1A7D
MRTLGVALLALMLALTYLLVQGATPDAGQHERTLDALRSLDLNNAALQRDVLRSRTGLLRSYDPLVQSVAALRQAAASLRTAGDIAQGEARAAIDQDVARLTAAIDDQERLVDDFKSSNAMLQNSLSYFNHTARQLDQAEGLRQTALGSEIGSLASAMLLFAADPRSEMAAELSAALDRLRSLDVPAAAAEGVDALVMHGHLILATLPTVDSLVARLQAAPIATQAQEIKQAYFFAYGRAATRALYFRLLLYAVAVGLAAYVCYLFLRLRANARALEKRLALENLIATISTDFINLPRASLDDGIERGLARLAGHMLFDRAHIFVWGLGTAPGDREYSWSQPQVPNTADTGRMLLDLANDWPIAAGVDDGTIHVPSVVALPDGPIKDRLALLGLRSWLSIPLGKAGSRSGVLMFEGVTAEKHWSTADVGLLRTAAESFANAIERERSEIRREALETQLAQSQRLESLGALAGGIAHEFNNILGAILGYGELALSTLTRTGSTQQYVKQIMTAGTRAQSVIDQILAFSRRRERRYRAIRPEPVVAEALELLRASLPPTIALHRRFAAGDAAILGDVTELQQIVMNLCTNASHAMTGQGRIEIGLDLARIPSDTVLSHGPLTGGDYLRLSVADSGHGIDPAVMKRIFEPFFTTKAVGSGTGLGLPTVYGIVTGQGGAMNVESRPGIGSTFEAYLPLTEEPVVDEEEVAEASSLWGRGETILVVDDETPLVLLLEEMLAALQYEPVGFDSSAAALAAFRADPDRFDLVLTDALMPDVTGIELAAELHRIRPGLPILMMTGHFGGLDSAEIEAAGILEVLRKPLRSRPLAERLAACLAPADSERVV